MKYFCDIRNNVSAIIKRLDVSVLANLRRIAPEHAVDLVRYTYGFFNNRLTGIVNKIETMLHELPRFPTKEESENIHKYALALQEGTELPKLTPYERDVYVHLRNILDFLATDIPRPPIGGRLIIVDPTYMMNSVLDKDVLNNIRAGKNLDEYRKELSDWWDKKGGKGSKQEYIERILAIGKGEGDVMSRIFFGPLYEPQGIGLPPSMRERDVIRAVRRFSLMTAGSSAFYETVLSFPPAAKVFGLARKDGKNPFVPKDDPMAFLFAGELVPDLGDTRPIQIILREMLHFANNDYRTIDKIAALSVSARLGIQSALRDAISSIGVVSTYTGVKDIGTLFQSFANVIAGKDEGIARGLVRKTGASDFFTPDRIYDDFLTTSASFLRRIQGREQAEVLLRRWLSEFGMLMARGAEAAEDPAAREKIYAGVLGANWKSLNPQARVELFGRKLMERVQGSYSWEGLPESLLLSTSNPILRFFFSLQRWAVERANNFLREAVLPAVEKGDLRPLLKQAVGFALGSAAIDPIIEDVLNVKPPGLTISEWLRLDKEEYPEKEKDLQYHLAAKLSYAGFAGMYSMLVETLLAIRTGDSIFPIENPGVSLVEDIFIKAINAFGAHGVSVSDLLVLPYEIFIDEVQNLRLLAHRDANKDRRRYYEAYERITGRRRAAVNLIRDPNPFSILSALNNPDIAVPSPEDIALYLTRRRYKEPPRLRRPEILRDSAFAEFMSDLLGPSEFRDMYLEAIRQEEELKRRQKLLNEVYELVYRAFSPYVKVE